MGAMFELDHLFVWTTPGGPEADRLIELGLTEGQPNTHPGQGTACRRFFFRNAYLELVWVHDPAEAQSDTTAPTGLWPRFSGRAKDASPFGLGLRPVLPGSEGVPFPGWEYRPSYLPSPLVIHVGEGGVVSEPWWFYLRFGRRPDDPGWPRPQPLDHEAGFREITSVRFLGPRFSTPSEVARRVQAAWAVMLTEAPEHLAEVTFDGGELGQAADLRPALPLVFRW
jgi:hypothetical protein